MNLPASSATPYAMRAMRDARESSGVEEGGIMRGVSVCIDGGVSRIGVEEKKEEKS